MGVVTPDGFVVKQVQVLSKVRGTQWYVAVTIESSVSVPDALGEKGFVGSVGCTLLKSTPTLLTKPAQLALQPSVRGWRLESIVVPSVIIGLQKSSCSSRDGFVSLTRKSSSPRTLGNGNSL